MASSINNAPQEELKSLLEIWEIDHENADWDPDPTLIKMAEILESATNEFLRNNPDPMDDRHPLKSQPQCQLGHLLKIVTKQMEGFINKLVITYLLTRDNPERNINSARLLLNLLPGIDTTDILADALPQLFRWAETSESRELRAYSMSLLGHAMDAENAHNYRQQNIVLIPMALQRLRELQSGVDQMVQPVPTPTADRKRRRTGSGSGTTSPTKDAEGTQAKRQKMIDNPFTECPSSSEVKEKQQQFVDVDPLSTSSLRHGQIPYPIAGASNFMDIHDNGENSNSSWRETMHPFWVGTHKLYPLSPEMEQRLILQYLTPTCEFQDYLSIILESHALDVVIAYLPDKDNSNSGCRDIRLLFDALKYISSLLIHRKFAWEFIAVQGVERLLKVNRFSIASTAVSTCLYYLAYSTDIMEKVCQLSDAILTELVDYALWLLDHSHESGRASSTMFFAYSLQFRTILDRFDHSDGLRRLYNYVSTLTILQNNEERAVNDEHFLQSIMTIKNAVCAFRAYLASHIFLKIEQLKKTHAINKHHHANLRTLPLPAGLPTSAHPHTKAMILNEEMEHECLQYLIQSQCMLQPHHSGWHPIEKLRNLGVFKLLFTLLSTFSDWNHFERQSKYETLKLILEVLQLATISPKVQLDICETIEIGKMPSLGLGQILEVLFWLAEGEVVSDSQVQRLALEVLCNCICGPTEQTKNNVSLGIHYRITPALNKELLPPGLSLPAKALTETDKTTAAQGVRVFLTPLDILQINWKCAQQNNAIMIFTNLLYTQSPQTEADILRLSACHALNGLGRYEPVRQILSKLPIIAANELNMLMQKPITLEKRMEHSRFCDQARRLIERVSQTSIQDMPYDLTQEKLWKAGVVAQTQIKFNSKELLQLIYQHLVDIGFKKTAVQLQAEAELPSTPASRIPSTPSSLQGFPRQNDSSFAQVIARRAIKPPMMAQDSSQPRTAVSGRQTPRISITPLNTPPALPPRLRPSIRATPSAPNTSQNSASFSGVSPFATPSATNHVTSTSSPAFSLQIRPHKTLSQIITEYFRNEHSMCRNPVANCPPFSLFYPHRCPEPKLLYSAPTNVVKRHLLRSTPPFRCTTELLQQADRRLIFSKYRLWKSFNEPTEMFTCSSFSHDGDYVLLGTFAGDMFAYNVRTGSQVTLSNLHHSAVTSIIPSKDGSLMLTSSAFVKPLSVLWKLNQTTHTQEHLIDFNDESWVDFASLSTDHIIGTQGPKATVYDTETGQAVVRLYDEHLSNHYTRNRAYFSPDDELVLNDGVLFDPHSGKVVHKYDKLNPDNSGVFHPKGSELIINREVWDLRTHRLLHTVPALNQCRLSFNSTGTIFFGIVYQPSEELDDRYLQTFCPSFRSFDSSNYQVITTVDTRKPLLDFCIDHRDNFVSALEVSRFTEDDANFCRLYEIGRKREVDEDDEEQDEPNAGEDDDFSSSSSSDSSSSSSSLTRYISDEDDGLDGISLVSAARSTNSTLSYHPSSGGSSDGTYMAASDPGDVPGTIELSDEHSDEDQDYQELDEEDGDEDEGDATDENNEDEEEDGDDIRYVLH